MTSSGFLKYSQSKSQRTGNGGPVGSRPWGCFLALKLPHGCCYLQQANRSRALHRWWAVGVPLLCFFGFLVLQNPIGVRDLGPSSLLPLMGSWALDKTLSFPVFGLFIVNGGIDWITLEPLDTTFSHFHLHHSLLLETTQNSSKFTLANTYQAATVSRILTNTPKY